MNPHLEAHAAEMRRREAEVRRAQIAAAMDKGRNRAGRPKRDAGPAMSPAMAEVLRRMAAGSDLFTGTGGFWVNGDTVYRSEQLATLAALKRRGWVEAVPGTERRFRLTAEGRDAATAARLGAIISPTAESGDGRNESNRLQEASCN